MRNSRVIESVSLVATVGAVLVMLMNAWPRPPLPDRGLHQAIGVTLAKQVLDLLGPGGQVIVITRDTETFPQPALDLLLASFQKELQRAGIKLAAIHSVQLDSLRPVEVPAGDFYERVRRAPAGQVIVSLLGPPLLSSEQLRTVGAIRAKIVAFCPGSTADSVDLEGLFNAGLLHAAVVSRPIASPPPKESKPGHSASFDELYLKMTAPDRSALPSPSSSSL
jgi:hypothetical protein